MATWPSDVSPILDHKSGNNSDNRPENLRYLCPPCDSQLVETRGGANKGRIEKSEGGFAIRDKSTGLRGFTLIAQPARYEISTTPPTVERVVLITVEPTVHKKFNLRALAGRPPESRRPQGYAVRGPSWVAVRLVSA
jgi:hypothetical protein